MLMLCAAIYAVIGVIVFGFLWWEDTGAPDLPGVRTGMLGITATAIVWPLLIVIAIVDWLFPEGNNP